MQRYKSVLGGLPVGVGLGFLLSFSSLVTSVSVQAQAPAAPTVEFLQVQPQELRQWSKYSAQISPVQSVEVRPLVGGRIDKVLFREGQYVEQGQDLFVIDPRPFEAAVKKAQANLLTAKARARLTLQELKRSQDLAASKLISQSILDEAQTADDVAQAAVLQAESSLLEAQLNLEYAHISAPIAGRVGRAELTLGNIVGAGPAAPVLTTIVARDQVYAEFRVDEASYLALVQQANTGDEQMPVRLLLSQAEQAKGETYQGYLHAFDNHLDASSGTIRARAIFENVNDDLTPGMYADVLLGSAQKQQALLIPERAIGTNQDRKFVMVIDEQNVAQYREVNLGRQVQGLRVVRQGLEPGDRVVVNGLARIRPNTPVQPVPDQTAKIQVSDDDVAAIEF